MAIRHINETTLNYSGSNYCKEFGFNTPFDVPSSWNLTRPRFAIDDVDDPWYSSFSSRNCGGWVLNTTVPTGIPKPPAKPKIKHLNYAD